SNADSGNVMEKFVSGQILAGQKKVNRQSDSFEEKIRLLQSAWAKKDYRIARAITNSLRISEIQTQAEEEDFGKPLVDAAQFGTVADLPAAWRNWAKGWQYYKVINLE